MKKRNRPEVFISHSHYDRDEAVYLKALLDENDAETTLDQEEFLPGDSLPAKIKKKITSCDKFLLIWSENAAASEWVVMEWETAFEKKKRIIPYLVNDLNDPPLPDALQNFLCIKHSDKKHGHGELFRAIFDELPEGPKGVDLFPGKWVAEIDIPDGSGSKTVYDLELRPNGQVTGIIKAQAAGVLGMVTKLAGADGLDLGFMMQPTPVRGDWSYERGSGLSLNLIQTAYGQQLPINLQIHTTGTRQNVLYGTGPGGARFAFRRKGMGVRPPWASTDEDDDEIEILDDDDDDEVEILNE